MHLSKPTECVMQAVNPDGKYGLWLIIMCCYWFINIYNKYIPKQDVGNKVTV